MKYPQRRQDSDREDRHEHGLHHDDRGARRRVELFDTRFEAGHSFVPIRPWRDAIKWHRVVKVKGRRWRPIPSKLLRLIR